MTVVTGVWITESSEDKGDLREGLFTATSQRELLHTHTQIPKWFSW